MTGPSIETVLKFYILRKTIKYKIDVISEIVHF